MPPEPAVFRSRLTRVREALLGKGLDALIFFDMKNIRYLTGFTGSDGALLVERGRIVLLVDGRYETQAGEEAVGAYVFRYRDKVAGLAEATAADGLKTLGFEATVGYDCYAKLRDALPEAQLLPLPDQTGSIRAVKDGEEIVSIRKAAGLAAATLAAMLDLIRPGARERDLALKLEYGMREGGAEEASFRTIVAAGKNSALPHADSGLRELQRGDALVVDFGAVCDGYHSDETCTFFVGACSERQKEAYDCLKEAHDRALRAVRAGARCNEIDRIARDCIRDGGFDGYFPHGTGHGVGLDIHEPPRLAPPSDAVLESGMVITIEPGIYIPGLWGMRIEDMVLVKEEGCEILTETPKDLTIIN